MSEKVETSKPRPLSETPEDVKIVADKRFDKIDLRTIERKLKNGEVTEKEYKEYLNSIEECTEYDTVNEETVMKNANVRKRF
ncbi:hypothetical protein J5834_05795 [bacterium]|nr:hypothetical protein [bacterium]